MFFLSPMLDVEIFYFNLIEVYYLHIVDGKLLGLDFFSILMGVGDLLNFFFCLEVILSRSGSSKS